MRALVCEAYGPVESLKIMDMPKPTPGPGETSSRSVPRA